MFGKRGSNDYDLNAAGASWWTSSKKDPRFNLNGSCASGIFSINEACEAAIKKKAEELGIDPPPDLEYGGVKD